MRENWGKLRTDRTLANFHSSKNWETFCLPPILSPESIASREAA